MDQDQTRVCKVCNIEKPITSFLLIKRINKYGHTCKECIYAKRKAKGYNKEYYKKHKDIIKARTKAYYQENKDTISDYKKDYAEKNKDKVKEYKAEYYKKNKDKIQDRFKKYYIENADKLIQYQKDYKKIDANKEKIRATRKAYKNNKLENDELFKLTEQLRNLIRWSFYRKGYQKRGKTKDIVGTDFDTFYKHLLKTYKDNYGCEWDGKENVHIDHIIPIATATTKDDVIKLCHYTNLQLLKAKDNLDKRDKLDYQINKD